MLKNFEKDSAYDPSTIQIPCNYHTHNFLCGHAGGTVCDYVKEAVAHGLKTIGISDHCASPLGTCEPYVMPKTLHSRYLPQFDEAREKYGDRIEILSAVEIEFFPDCDEYYETLLTDLDYLVLGQHEYLMNGRKQNSFCDGVDEKNIAAYCKNVEQGLKSGFFALLAHPDLIFYRRPQMTEEIKNVFEHMIRTAVDCDVTLELNANGIRYHNFNYPTDLLVDLCKKYDAKVVVSADCHSPDALCDDCTMRLTAYARKHKLKLVDKII